MHAHKFKRFDLNEHLNDICGDGVVLISVLNWGLGHATRCIPIISQLSKQSREVIIASDGMALEFLKFHFPQIKFYTLPPYNISYARFGFFNALKIAFQFYKITNNVQRESLAIQKIVRLENVKTIISDSRFGARCEGIRNIYLTHQLRIIFGFSGILASLWHQRIIEKFDICWVPDMEGFPNLSGSLSHGIKLKIPIHYIDLLSNLNIRKVVKIYDVCILLSGPEPQRSLWENQLMNSYSNTVLNICLVRGVVEEKKTKTKKGNIEIYNFLYGEDLELLINASEKVIARSGYSTLMDLALLNKKAALKATPNQPEQEYLEKYARKHQFFK